MRVSAILLSIGLLAEFLVGCRHDASLAPVGQYPAGIKTSTPQRKLPPIPGGREPEDFLTARDWLSQRQPSCRLDAASGPAPWLTSFSFESADEPNIAFTIVPPLKGKVLVTMDAPTVSIEQRPLRRVRIAYAWPDWDVTVDGAWGGRPHYSSLQVLDRPQSFEGIVTDVDLRGELFGEPTVSIAYIQLDDLSGLLGPLGAAVSTAVLLCDPQGFGSVYSELRRLQKTVPCRTWGFVGY